MGIKSKVITAILNCNMKTFTMSSLILLIVAIAFIANATGRQLRPETMKCLATARKCREEFGSGNGSADFVECCKGKYQEKFQKKISKECMNHCERIKPAKQLQK